MRVRGFPLADSRGQVTRFAGIGEDFSLRKADEERREAQREDLEVLVAQKTLALEESLRLFEAMASQSPTGIYRTDLSGKNTFVNSRYCEIAGLQPEEALGTGWVTAIRPEERDEALSAWKAAVSEFQTPYSREMRFAGKNREVRIAIAHAQLELDTSGRPIGYIGSLVDVTDLRRLEDLLLRTEYLARVGSWEWDIASGRVRWSPEMYRLHAVEAKPDGKPDLDRVVQWISPEDVSFARGSLEKALNTGSLEPVHYSVNSQDGAVRHLVGEGEVEFGLDGKPAKLRGFVQDLTERELARQALERSLAEKSVLLKEIHHRVKNSLQIVASLLYLQGRRSKDETTRLMIGESRDRLISMALIHEMLYQADDLSRIDFGTYLRRLVDRIFAAYGGGGFTVRTEVFSNAEPIEIGVAIPCGLIVNELATNAFKYAFQENGGCLRATFTQEGRQFRLEVADDGAGLAPEIDLNLADTFGFTIVRTLATQLEGELTLDRGSAGTRISISFCRGGRRE
jgi:PAS domain S-box-containing protein